MVTLNILELWGNKMNPRNIFVNRSDYDYDVSAGQSNSATNVPALGENYKVKLSDSTNPKDLSYGKKLPLSLVPSILVRKVAECMKDGAIKRSPFNWRKDKISAMQTLDKILRHVYDCLDGKDLTEDTQLSNLAAAAADIAVYLDAQEYGSLIDDRPNKV